MKHLSEGILRAYLDGALSPEEHEEVKHHLRTCRRCATEATVLRGRRDRVQILLSELEPAFTPEETTGDLVRRRFGIYRHKREEERMVRNPFSRRYRLAWALAALVLLMGVTLTVPAFRSVAADLLGIFRIERIAFTPVDVEALPDEASIEALAPEIERMFGDALDVVAESSPQDVTEAEARTTAGFPVRLPAGEDASGHEWTPPTHIEMTIDLHQLQALFAELGYTDVALPKELDGSTVEADLSGILTSHFGSCEEAVDGDCITLVQMKSPEVEIPDGLDVRQLGRIYLELLGTPAGEAAALSEQIDWTSTLVLPFPHHVNLTHEAISVGGVEGTLIHSESSYRPAREYLLTWVENDIIYALTGEGDHAEAAQLATSLR